MTSMHDDYRELGSLLAEAALLAQAFHASLPERPVAARTLDIDSPRPLPAMGIGARRALDDFVQRFLKDMSGSVGPRYLGYMTGGATPASILGDWLAIAIDQNVGGPGDSISIAVSVQAFAWLKELFRLPQGFDGAFTTGATGANFACLVAAREWAGERVGYKVGQQGMMGAPPMAIYVCKPHASITKVARLIGFGADAIRFVPCLANSEVMDLEALDAMLQRAPQGEQKIICASAGTVHTAAFDDFPQLSSLCHEHGAFLHVDGAFGLFARTVPELAARLHGVELADSIASDGHKWLNVPHDSGFYFTRHVDLFERAAGALPVYLDMASPGMPRYINRTLEGSQRFRALAVWMTLAAYGEQGVQQIVRASCRDAQCLSVWIDESDRYELLAPTSLNVVCFRGSPPSGVDEDEFNRCLLQAINDDGSVFLTPGSYRGKLGMRAAFANWMTGPADVELVTTALARAHAAVVTPR